MIVTWVSYFIRNAKLISNFILSSTFIKQNFPLKRRRQWHPIPVLLPGKSHGQRSLVGCSSWGREESDTTEWLHFHALEKEMATHSSVLAWRIPGTGEPCGLPSMGSHRVGHDWSDLAAAVSQRMKLGRICVIAWLMKQCDKIKHIMISSILIPSVELLLALMLPDGPHRCSTTCYCILFSNGFVCQILFLLVNG